MTICYPIAELYYHSIMGLARVEPQIIIGVHEFTLIGKPMFSYVGKLSSNNLSTITSFQLRFHRA